MWNVQVQIAMFDIVTQTKFPGDGTIVLLWKCTVEELQSWLLIYLHNSYSASDWLSIW